MVRWTSSAVAGVDDVDGHLDDVGELAAGFFEQHCDVRHRFLRLGGDITDADRLSGVQILTDLSARWSDTAGDDGLTEIVVEALLRIGVAWC